MPSIGGSVAHYEVLNAPPLALTQICRQYTMMNRHEHRPASDMMVNRVPAARGLHWSTWQLNLSRFGHTSLCPPV